MSNILLIGGAGSLMNSLIIKLKKEKHKVYLLTGSRFGDGGYEKVFEKYDFTYDTACLNDIFDSTNPDITIFMGAQDTNFSWADEDRDAVRYTTCMMNLLMGYSVRGRGRFIYLSSHEVYGESYDLAVPEGEEARPIGQKGRTLLQCEELCDSFRRTRNLDIVTLRLDHLFTIPGDKRDVRDVVTRLCLEALEKNTVTVTSDDTISLLYEKDAVEDIYRFVKSPSHKYDIYNLSSTEPISVRDIAELVRGACNTEVALITPPDMGKRTLVLSNNLFNSEFGGFYKGTAGEIIPRIIERIDTNRYIFIAGEKDRLPLMERLKRGGGWVFSALFPYLENIVVFLLIFLIQGTSLAGEYFGRLDFFLLYVILFAVIYGQQQAIASGLLATIGYLISRMGSSTGSEVLLDHNTYVWLAQLFIIGLTIGYMRDQIRKLRNEGDEEKHYIEQQLTDIQDINNSNVRVKDALETQILNQSDSVGKIYEITRELDNVKQEAVIFYAARTVSGLIGSRDVAIYVVSNADYARLYSSTSSKARSLGHSIKYTDMGVVYETLLDNRVYINRNMDDRYPAMVSAIYQDDRIRLIFMVWNLQWEQMTLGQANQLTIVGSLIQNAVLRADNHLKDLESQRYVEGSSMMATGAFSALVNAHMDASSKDLTECVVLQVEADPEHYVDAGNQLSTKLRNSDYVGTLPDGNLYVLLSNTDEDSSDFIISRFREMGYESHIVQDAIWQNGNTDSEEVA